MRKILARPVDFYYRSGAQVSYCDKLGHVSINAVTKDDGRAEIYFKEQKRWDYFRESEYNEIMEFVKFIRT